MSAARLDGLVVLLVDDDDDLRTLLALALESRGARVEEAGDAPQARRKIQDTQPAVMVCDIGLPGEDGCSLLRSLAGKSDVPAIALTGSPEPSAESEVTRAGYRKQLPKPVEFERLVEAIASVVEARGSV